MRTGKICAGIADTLDYISALTGRREIHALIGGLHLAKAGPDELEAAANAIAVRNPFCSGASPGRCGRPEQALCSNSESHDQNGQT